MKQMETMLFNRELICTAQLYSDLIVTAARRQSIKFQVPGNFSVYSVYLSTLSHQTACHWGASQVPKIKEPRSFWRGYRGSLFEGQEQHRKIPPQVMEVPLDSDHNTA